MDRNVTLGPGNVGRMPRTMGVDGQDKVAASSTGTPGTHRRKVGGKLAINMGRVFRGKTTHLGHNSPGNLFTDQARSEGTGGLSHGPQTQGESKLTPRRRRRNLADHRHLTNHRLGNLARLDPKHRQRPAQLQTLGIHSGNQHSLASLSGTNDPIALGDPLNLFDPDIIEHTFESTRENHPDQGVHPQISTKFRPRSTLRGDHGTTASTGKV